MTKMTADFCIGQVDGVREYLLEQIPHLSKRLGISGGDRSRLTELFLDSLEDCIPRLETDREAGLVFAMPRPRQLFNFLGELLLIPGSCLVDDHYFEEAMNFQQSGGNVLLVQNHTSGADVLATDFLLNSKFGGVAEQFIWMAGHVVTLFTMPLLLAAAQNRCQIFSVKYCSMAACEGGAGEMRGHNCRALYSLHQETSGGGKYVFLYPEGGRGEGALIEGVPQTMKIPDILDECSEGVMILPSFVSGATTVLPVVRGEHEFSQYLEHVGRGAVTVTFGPPVMWRDINRQWPDLVGKKNKEERLGLKRKQITAVMEMIADLAPSEEAKGQYNSMKMEVV